jgi:hypothetical protein
VERLKAVSAAKAGNAKRTPHDVRA